MLKAKLNTKIYSSIYEKIKIYNSKAKNNTNLIVTKNPTFI